MIEFQKNNPQSITENLPDMSCLIHNDTDQIRKIQEEFANKLKDETAADEIKTYFIDIISQKYAGLSLHDAWNLYKKENHIE